MSKIKIRPATIADLEDYQTRPVEIITINSDALTHNPALGAEALTLIARLRDKVRTGDLPGVIVEERYNIVAFSVPKSPETLESLLRAAQRDWDQNTRSLAMILHQGRESVSPHFSDATIRRWAEERGKNPDDYVAPEAEDAEVKA